MPICRPANPRCGIRRGFISASPFRSSRISMPRRRVEAVAKSKGDLALIAAGGSRSPWWLALEPAEAPKIIARLPFVERADHPAALPVFVISRVAEDAMVTEVEMWSIRVSGWSAAIARALSPFAEIIAVPDTASDGAALLISVPGFGRARQDHRGAGRGRGFRALIGPRREPCNALYGPPIQSLNFFSELNRCHVPCRSQAFSILHPTRRARAARG